jgi:hypothetical protein
MAYFSGEKMDKIDEARKKIRSLIFDEAVKKDREARKVGDNIYLSENLKGYADGLRGAFYLIEDILNDLK